MSNGILKDTKAHEFTPAICHYFLTFALGSRLVSREWDVFQLVVICTVAFLRNLLQGSLFLFCFGDPCSGRDSLHARGKREDVKSDVSKRKQDRTKFNLNTRPNFNTVILKSPPGQGWWAKYEMARSY